MWTEQKTELLKDEVERIFKERTPPTRIDEIAPENRVNRAEIRSISLRLFGEMPPDVDPQWAQAFADWYVRMAKRIMKAKGEITNPMAKRLGKGLRQG